MSSAKITLLGFYNWDSTLFDLLDLPTGIESGLLIDTILMRGGEYEVIYSNPKLLKDLIGSWSTRWKPVFTNWLRANTALGESAPLENYDRIEAWSDSASTSESSAGSSSTSTSDSSSASESMSETANVSAYDSATLVPDSSGNKVAGTHTNGTGFTQQGNTLNSSGTSYSTHGGRTHGNIGVTTTAQMYKEWYQVLANVGDIYDAIATLFLQSFVIPII